MCRPDSGWIRSSFIQDCSDAVSRLRLPFGPMAIADFARVGWNKLDARSCDDDHALSYSADGSTGSRHVGSGKLDKTKRRIGQSGLEGAERDCN